MGGPRGRLRSHAVRAEPNHDPARVRPSARRRRVGHDVQLARLCAVPRLHLPPPLSSFAPPSLRVLARDTACPSTGRGHCGLGTSESSSTASPTHRSPGDACRFALGTAGRPGGAPSSQRASPANAPWRVRPRRKWLPAALRPRHDSSPVRIERSRSCRRVLNSRGDRRAARRIRPPTHPARPWPLGQPSRAERVMTAADRARWAAPGRRRREPTSRSVSEAQAAIRSVTGGRRLARTRRPQRGRGRCGPSSSSQPAARSAPRSARCSRPSAGSTDPRRRRAHLPRSAAADVMPLSGDRVPIANPVVPSPSAPQGGGSRASEQPFTNRSRTVGQSSPREPARRWLEVGVRSSRVPVVPSALGCRGRCRRRSSFRAGRPAGNGAEKLLHPERRVPPPPRGRPTSKVRPDLRGRRCRRRPPAAPRPSAGRRKLAPALRPECPLARGVGDHGLGLPRPRFFVGRQPRWEGRATL